MGVPCAGDSELGSTISNHVCFPCGFLRGGGDDGNSLNCKSYLLNPRCLSLNWEKRKQQQPSSGPPRCCQKLGTFLKADQNVGLTHKRVSTLAFKSSSMELCNGVIMLFFGSIQSFMASIGPNIYIYI